MTFQDQLDTMTEANPQEPELLQARIEAAAKALHYKKYTYSANRGHYDTLSERGKNSWRNLAKVAIEAADAITRATPPKAEGGRPDGCGTKCMSASDMAQKCIRLMDDLGHSDLANQIALRWGTDYQKKCLASNKVVEK